MRQPGTPWTRREDDRLRRNWAKDVPVPRMAERLGRSQRSVCARVAALGLPRRATRWGAPEDAQLRRLWSAGASADVIAAAVGRSPAAVYMRARLLGLSRRRAA